MEVQRYNSAKIEQCSIWTDRESGAEVRLDTKTRTGSEAETEAEVKWCGSVQVNPKDISTRFDSIDSVRQARDKLGALVDLWEKAVADVGRDR